MIAGRELSETIANEWDQIAQALGEDRERFEHLLMTLLRQLEGAETSGQTAITQAILTLFQQSEAAYRKLVEAIGRTRSKGALEMEGFGIPSFQQKVRYAVVPVFYATDRAIVGGHDVPLSYGAERGELGFGVASVSIPDDHRMGRIERPRWWKLQFREDPDKHVVVLELESMALESFTSRAASLLDRSSRKEVLLFVHGYNVGFTEAVSRAAQIAYDLHFEGLAALYSWPSEGSMPKYTIDANNVAWSKPRFARFLGILRENLGADVIHILAHSMGNRLVVETIAAMVEPAGAHDSRIRQVIMAAPDVDAATFKDLAVAFEGKAERFTLYASSEDKALKASRLIQRYARAGESGLDLVVVDSVDTIDATAVDTSLVGHSYYGDNRSVLTDIFELVRRGSPPQERAGLNPRHRYGALYWSFMA